MNVAEILEIRGVDSDIRQDLYKVLPRREYEILGSDNGAAEEPDRVLIRKCCWSDELQFGGAPGFLLFAEWLPAEKKSLQAVRKTGGAKLRRLPP